MPVLVVEETRPFGRQCLEAHQTLTRVNRLLSSVHPFKSPTP